MRVMMKLFIFLGLLCSLVGRARELDVGCDVVGDHLKVIKKVASQGMCKTLCDSNLQCRGFVYISGWNRCFLKKNIHRKVKVRMISGKKGQKANIDFDFSGKDMRQHAVSTVKKCQDLCRNEDLCYGFTYIQGYSTCWLKKEGALRRKIFYCGVKKRS